MFAMGCNCLARIFALVFGNGQNKKFKLRPSFLSFCVTQTFLKKGYIPKE